MPLTPMTELLARAAAGNYAVGYFEAWDVDSLEAVIGAAEAEAAPVIVGFGGAMAAGTWLDAGGVEVLAGIGLALASRSRVPTALLFNEAHTLAQARRAVDAGFNAVMLDTSAWSWDDAIADVTRLVEYAHERGASVEAELGRLPDAVAGGVDDSQASLTDPQQAAEFAQRTGIDCLAVSVGNVHLLRDGLAPVDMAHLEAIRACVPLPLVMHGGTSFPPDEVPRAIAAGVGKFNVGTVLKGEFLNGVRRSVTSWPADVDVHDVLGSHKGTDMLAEGKARMQSRVQRLIRLYRGGGSR
ncbi:MAG: class II fructose-bisphosphate aldolase [bacterium]|nr:class II fructose-bisphosphate aldolase [bacterium]